MDTGHILIRSSFCYLILRFKVLLLIADLGLLKLARGFLPPNFDVVFGLDLKFHRCPPGSIKYVTYIQTHIHTQMTSIKMSFSNCANLKFAVLGPTL